MDYKHLFLDSDILLDIFLNRVPFYEPAADVMLLSEGDDHVCCTSVHTLLNAHYILKKSFGEAKARTVIKIIKSRLKVVAEDISLIEKAIDSRFSDFEDAVQYFAAISAGADVIITRNVKDYKQSTIPVLTAEEFLKTL